MIAGLGIYNCRSLQLEDEDFPEYKEELCELYPWLLVYLNRFDRQEVNQGLQQYVAGDKEMLFKQRIM